MKDKTALGASYYEIVKYNLRTRKDIQVLPKQFQVLSEANRKIDTLNTRLRAAKKDEGGDVIYYRRKVRIE
jgi:hypothetical protein